MLLALLPLLAPQQGTTPTDFDVRVLELSVSEDGVTWLSLFDDAGGVAVDLGDQLPHDVATVEVPETSWSHVRIGLSTQVQLQAPDPCGSGQTIYHSVDLMGDPTHDPDGDGRWVLHYSTADAGGHVAGTGSLLTPALLDRAIQPRRGFATNVRVLLETSGTVHCDGAAVSLDVPRLRVVSDDETSDGASLEGARFQIAGLVATPSAQLPRFSSLQGVLELHADGRWSVEQGSFRSTNLGTDQSIIEDPADLTGLWGARGDGALWMTLAGYPGILSGTLDQSQETLALSGVADSQMRLVIFGHRWPQSAPADPFIPPTRFLHYGVTTEVYDEAPLDGDLVWRDAWGSLSGSGGWATFSNSVIVNELRLFHCFEPAPWQVALDSGPIPFNQGAPFQVLTTGGEMDLDLLDWSLPHHGSVISDGRWTLSAPTSASGLAHGLTMTVAIPGSVTGNPLAGRELSGSWFGDRAGSSSTQVDAGFFRVAFASDGTCTWTQETHGSGIDQPRHTFEGTWSMDSTGVVSIDLPGVGRWRGQLSDTPRLLALTSSPDGTGGANDRFLGLLLWP